ncbi:hypothetical protein ACLB2K_037579 [Fragaria x ananassa]
MIASLANFLSASKKNRWISAISIFLQKNSRHQGFYLVGRLNTEKAVVFDSFKSVVYTMWMMPIPVEVQAKVDHFRFTFTSERDMTRVKRGGLWGFQRAMIQLNDYVWLSEIMLVPLDFVWILVEISGPLIALTTTATTRVVGQTIEYVLLVDQPSVNRGVVLVLVTVPLNKHVCLDRRIRVSPMDVLQIKFCYESLMG